MGNQELKKEDKRIVAIINTCDNNLVNGLEVLSKYQEQNNIERIHKYYITNDYEEDISLGIFISIVEVVNIDTILLVDLFDVEDNYYMIKKIEINIETEEVAGD